MTPAETCCWNCCAFYPGWIRHCPSCGATNGNVDLETANAEALGERELARAARTDWSHLEAGWAGALTTGRIAA